MIMNLKFSAKIVTALALVLCAGLAQAQIRFYQLNRQGQQVNMLFTFNTDEEGCHSFPLERGVHRVAIVNFAYCELYSGRSCEPGGEVPARWKNRADEEKTRLTPGSRWILKEDGHVDVGSWKCVK
jgi:hypothetical protein